LENRNIFIIFVVEFIDIVVLYLESFWPGLNPHYW